MTPPAVALPLLGVVAAEQPSGAEDSLGQRAEEMLQDVVSLLVMVVEACGAAVIIVGAAWAFLRFLRVSVTRADRDFVSIRLTLGRFLALGLEFQLASDILRTAVAPSFRELGQLAIVAAIRTALNYFLSREITEERRQVTERDTERAAGRSTGHDTGHGTGHAAGRAEA